MAGLLLSPSEKIFILHGVEDDFRSDGRTNADYRPMELETDVVSHASGSARLRLANTDILVGVKTEIDVPKPDKPNLGKIEFFVDWYIKMNHCVLVSLKLENGWTDLANFGIELLVEVQRRFKSSANATPEFEGRGGEGLATNISSMMQNAYHSSQAFNLKQLCIFEGKQCWKLYVDILILECGGNLCDAVSLAVKAALFNTRIPFVKAALMDGGNVDLQLSDDPYDSKLLDIGTAPLLVTLCQIGDKCVVDPSAEEESCSLISLIVGVTGNPKYYCSEETPNADQSSGKCSTICMNGPGSIASKTLKDAISQGILAAKSLDQALGNALLRERQENIGLKKHSYGFLK